ncbi:MAG: radical SAM protein [Deltaproteobacteria bacterium]|nr:MAG: radical SAM protein [Deltaproteobacteria bacterium]
MEKANRDHAYYSLTTGMCRECRRLVDAKIVIRDGQVFQQNVCPDHGVREALIAEDAARYLEVVRVPGRHRPPEVYSKPIDYGCPLDCGLCPFHVQACNLPVVSITNACNLECPICFTYNRKDKIYNMSPEELRRTVDWIIESSGPVDLINVTGGEPTLHPRLPDMLDECRRPEIGRITMNTNGLRLADDGGLARELAARGVYAVVSFNTYSGKTCAALHGRDILAEKMQALETLKKHAVPTTLLNVMIRDVNDGEIGRIIDTAMQEDFIRSVTVQTMTYTGFGGRKFGPRAHLPVDGVLARIEEQTAGRIRKSDFLPLPSAHPLCYAVTMLITDGGGSFVPLARYIDIGVLRQVLEAGYLPHPEGTFFEAANRAIAEQWARPDRSPEDDRFLKIARKILDETYPPGTDLTPHQRQVRAERFIKTIYVHAHMDEDTFDVDRARRCGDLVPDRPGSLISACTYNLFYRQKDERYWKGDES